MGKGTGCGSSTMKSSPPTSDEKEEVPKVESKAVPVAEAPVEPVPSQVVEEQEPLVEKVPEKSEAVIIEESETTSEVKTPAPEEPAVELPAEPEKAPEAVEETAAPDGEEPIEDFQEDLPAKVYIVYYSMYGHVAALAAKVKEGVESVEGAEGYLFQVPETLSESVLAKMGAPPKSKDIPVIRTKDLVDGDAFLFGIPTRFGLMCSQMKSFFDSTGSLWQSQALAGKPAGFFFSTGTQAGGQETTALTAISQLSHHGLMFVPIGYTNTALFSNDVHGGSPYGAGTLSGDGTRFPSDLELEIAAHQGRQMALLVKKLLKGAEYI